MLTLHCIVRTDLGEDVIVETYPTAEGARLFMERQEGGPFRVAVLAERKTVNADAVTRSFKTILAASQAAAKAGV